MPLAAVPELVASARRSGLDVSCDIEGRVDSLPSGLDLAAYRILQEGLTNAIKHSSAGAAAVTVAVTPKRVTLQVTNPVRPPAGPGVVVGGSGLGLVGMRERAAMYGGQVHAGAVAGVWSTRATLRLEP